MKKIKVLHIQETIGSGGVERLRLSLAKHLDKNQFDQKFICTNESGSIPELIRSEGWEVISIGKFSSPFDWKNHKKVQKIIDKYQPDIIHGAVFEGVTLAAINGWIKNVPNIIIEETSDPQNRTWKGDLLMKIFARISTKVIGVSEDVSQSYLKNKLKINPNKLITINNGVKSPNLIGEGERIATKVKFEIQPKDFVFGSVGRMLDDEHKRFSDLIKAFALFSKDKKYVKLLLVGDGPRKEDYIKLCEDLGISDLVIFAGVQENVDLFYSIMNVFCLVSAREAFGLVLVEAMMNSVPVIGTKVGGIQYIVEDEISGFLVEPKNVEMISERMNLLYQNSELRNDMGEKGREIAFAKFSEEIYIRNIQNLYLNVHSSKNI